MNELLRRRFESQKPHFCGVCDKYHRHLYLVKNCEENNKPELIIMDNSRYAKKFLIEITCKTKCEHNENGICMLPLYFYNDSFRCKKGIVKINAMFGLVKVN